MQVVDWISTGGWTDKPVCVHPVVRDLAIKFNDSMTDEERQRLLDLAPRMMGTSAFSQSLRHHEGIDQATAMLSALLRILAVDYPPRGFFASITPNLRGVFGRQVQKVSDAIRNGDKDTVRSVRTWLEKKNRHAWKRGGVNVGDAVALENIAYHYLLGWSTNNCIFAVALAPSDSSARLDRFTKVLDAMNTIIGRDRVEPIDFAPVCKVMNNAKSREMAVGAV